MGLFTPWLPFPRLTDLAGTWGTEASACSIWQPAPRAGRRESSDPAAVWPHVGQGDAAVAGEIGGSGR
jgi:hypothetical protein